MDLSMGEREQDKKEKVEWLKNNLPQKEKAKRMFLINRRQAEQNQTPPIKENNIAKKKIINKDSIIVSAVFAILGLAGYWVLMWNFHEIVIYAFIFGTLIKFILIILGKDNE